MTKQEILDLIKDARDMGLKSIEIEGIKVEFNSNPSSIQKPAENRPETMNNSEVLAEDLVAKPNPFDELTEEEILYWSSDYGVELAEARRKEQLDAIQRKQEDDART